MSDSEQISKLQPIRYTQFVSRLQNYIDITCRLETGISTQSNYDDVEIMKSIEN